MDKGLGNDESTNNNSISSSSAAASSNNRDMFIKQVNKNSHKIAKPIRKPLPLPTTASAAASSSDPNPLNPGLGQPQSQQPPVYNINKNDFRDVVQKLTGSPAHERFPTPPPPPPPVTHPRPPSSRLQRIRPPPLAQITNRPPQLNQQLPRPQNDVGQRGPPAAQGQAFTPLPPLPSVHPAAESPISAYMRFLQSSSPSPSPLWNAVPPTGHRPDSLMPQNEFGQRPPFSSMTPPESPISAYMRYLQNSAASSSAPRQGNGVTLPPPQPPFFAPQHHHPPPSSASFPPLPLSPLPFGCIPSPRSPYGMNSPSFLFSPTGQFGMPQLPLSPTPPVTSPRWKGM
ncbi:PREDICTED: VQ motif-containing protein 9 [Erythranthe guttata]|nr:PREDICTED: VQ motif-containing protein 9 [Erythranthe guttata]|eukprot:XP_012838888.1 PREDICTED: VQ motif-containing protein 9 [Erythranthe guttata]